MNYKQLKQFSHSYRAGINLPWSEGDYSYASNGKVLIRVPRLPEVPERSTAPRKIEGEVLWEPVGCQWMPMPTVYPSKKEPCFKCVGGVHSCGCGDQHACHSCNGTGFVSTDETMGICGKIVFLKDIALLCGLPGAEIPHMVIADDRCSVPFRFWASEGKRGIGVVTTKAEAINGG